MRLPVFALTAALLAPAFLLTGCSGGGSQATSAAPTPTAAPALARPVQIIAKVSGDRLPIVSYGLGVLDQAAVDGLGLGQAFADAGAPIDLAVHSVVLLSLGEQGTGGFSADINGLQLKGDELYVQGTAVAPGSGAVVPQVVSYPYCAVAVPKLPAGLTLLSDITSLP